MVHAKLRVGPAGDRQEREAARLATEITGGWHGDASAHARRPGTEGGPVAPKLQRDIQRALGRGQSLPGHVRAPVEQALGADFSHVRLHTDNEADRLSRSLQAQAFTTGGDIFLRRGQAGLTSPAGRKLIAHELTHVAQQADTGAGQGVIQRMLEFVRNPSKPDEVYDTRKKVVATRDPSYPGTFLDASGTRYEIGKDAAGVDTLVPIKNFTIASAQPAWSMTTTPTAAPVYKWNPKPVKRHWWSPRQTEYSLSPGGGVYKPGPVKGKYRKDTRRKAAGFVNPKQFATNMLPLWETAHVGPLPPGTITNAQKRKHFQDPTTSFTVKDGPTTTTTITGYRDTTKKRSKFVLGHDISAGDIFNTGGSYPSGLSHPAGHTVPRNVNYNFNQTATPYHGLETAGSSAASGHLEARYLSPQPHRESHRSYWDAASTGYTGGPWHSWERVLAPDMVTYITQKLNGVAPKARDGTWHAAFIKLQKLMQAYSQALAHDLLSVIESQGW